MSGLEPIHIVLPDIEETIHHEDVYKADRLNRDIDINDIDIRGVIHLMKQRDNQLQPIPTAVIRHLSHKTMPIRFQLDSGANKSITPYKELLHDLRQIKSTPIDGVGGVVTVQYEGNMRLQCDDNSSIWVRTYYSPEVNETIVSPNDITLSPTNNFTSYTKHCNVIDGNGYLQFQSRSGLASATIQLHMNNGLWYAYQQMNDITEHYYSHINPIIRSMSSAAEFELWHQRLGHAGEAVMKTIHKCVDGVPDLQPGRNYFHRCESCMKGKVVSAKKNKQTLTTTTERGQQFHMDFGFVRGSKYKAVNEKGKIVTSKDGYNSYLIIVDAFTRYTWIFLSATKEPPLDIVRSFLDRNGIKHGSFRQVRCDQGGELSRSSRFRQVVQECGYSIEPTSADNSSQNGVAERPNRTFGNMMRSMLLNAGLGPEYWSYALLQSVFIKNRLPHQHHNNMKTPFEAFTGRKPNLRGLRVFGSRVIAKNPGARSAKLDDNTSSGIFLHHTSTTSISKYIDDRTGREKITSHITFDEAHFTCQRKPLGSERLINTGYKSRDNTDTNSTDIDIVEVQTHSHENAENELKVQLLSPQAKLPTRATPGSAGLDLYGTKTITIKPNEIALIPTDIAIMCPAHTYGRIAPRSGLTIKRKLDIRAGVIDSDYRGNVLVAVQNIGEEDQTLNVGDKIAQLILERIVPATVREETELDRTQRNTDGFGSTDNPDVIINVHDLPEPSPTQVAERPEFIPFHPDEITPTIHSLDIKSEGIYMSSCPFGPTIEIEVSTKGEHPMLGFEIDDRNMKGRLTLLNCTKSTPSHRIPRWRSTLRNSNIIEIDGTPVSTIQQLKQLISDARQRMKQHIIVKFATEERISIHPQNGTPQIYFDQLNVIAKHLHEIKTGETIEYTGEHDQITPTIHRLKKGKKFSQFSRKELLQADDWNDWKMSEYKQLDQYEMQNTFDHPEPRPHNANVLNLLWTYLIKADGTKKARCVCNGSPKAKGTVTLGHTFAACLEQPGARTFWASAALLDLIVIGADASNAFAEAPPPKAPLYVVVDQQFREWWRSKGREDIPPGYVMRVNCALQGHPESPRLWSKLIDKILREDIGLSPTRHEPCLYSGTVDDKKVLFLRQVDDFAIACKDTGVAHSIIERISSKLSAPMKYLGIVDRYNGVDIDQTMDYIKLHSKTYLTKILKSHNWLTDNEKEKQFPTPMRDDSAYLNILDTAKGPESEEERIKLEEEAGFSYRTALGEALFAMITCRPDISFAIIKLSKYANSPAKEHYTAMKKVFRYLRATLEDGITYWRKDTTEDIRLKPSTTPRIYHQQSIPLPTKDPTKLIGSADSDWASDTESRKSVSGIVMHLAGGAVHYKTRYQQVVAHSSTEAEFVAACDASKIALYLRSILEDIGIDQQEATLIMEDNSGALLMANTGQPTRRTRHIDVKHFAIQDWVEQDLILLEVIKTDDNSADHFTKALGRNLFHMHNDVIMGRIPPMYYQGPIQPTYEDPKAQVTYMLY